ARHRGEVGIGGQALHRVASRVDRVEPALEAGLAVIAQRTAADAGRVVGGPEDRYRAGGEKRGQGMCGHVGAIATESGNAGASKCETRPRASLSAASRMCA